MIITNSKNHLITKKKYLWLLDTKLIYYKILIIKIIK